VRLFEQVAEHIGRRWRRVKTGYGAILVQWPPQPRIILPLRAAVAWGNPEAIARRVREHHDAGADHVCIQVIGGGDGLPLGAYRELAAILIGG
jgi:hypothetical protein